MLLNCGVGEDSWESLGLQGDPTSPSKGNQSWIFIGRTDAKAETPIIWPPDVKNWLIWKRPWCWEILKAGGEGDDWGWDGWMASQTWWTWVWVSSRSWRWTGKPGVLQCMGSQSRTWLRNWTELNWTEQEPAYQCRRYKRQGFDPCIGKVLWKSECLLTPVFLPGESHGQRRLLGYSPWVTKSQTWLKSLSSSSNKIQGRVPRQRWSGDHTLRTTLVYQLLTINQETTFWQGKMVSLF